MRSTTDPGDDPPTVPDHQHRATNVSLNGTEYVTCININVNDEYCTVELVKDQHGNVERAKDQCSNIEGVKDKHGNIGGVNNEGDNQHCNIEGVYDVGDNIKVVKDQHSNIGRNVTLNGIDNVTCINIHMNDEDCTVELVKDQHGNIERVKDQCSNIEGVEDQHSNIGGVKDQHGNIELVKDQCSNIEGVKDEHSNIGGVKDQCSNIEGVKDQHSNIGGVKDQHSNTEVVKDEHGNIEHVEDEQSSVKSAKDKQGTVVGEKAEHSTGTALRQEKVDVVDLTLTDSDSETEINALVSQRVHDAKNRTLNDRYSKLRANVKGKRKATTKGYKCPNCNYSAADMDGAMQHMVDHHVSVKHGNGHFKVADKVPLFFHDHSVNSDGDKNTHHQHGVMLPSTFQREIGDDGYKCPDCEYSAPLMDTVLQHMVQKHVKIKHRENKGATDQYKDSANRDESSPFSRHKFKRAGRTDRIVAKRPKVTQNPEAKGFKCSGCEYETPELEELVQHMIQSHVKVEHSTETEIDRMSDRNTEHTVSTYRCNVCNYTARQESDLFAHVKRSHKSIVKVHKCPDCKFKAGTVTELVIHTKAKHHCVDDWQTCTQCEYVGETFSDVIRHVEKVHCVISVEDGALGSTASVESKSESTVGALTDT